MANARGLLPKARREDLTDDLRRRLERWYRDAYEDDNLFLTLARRPGLRWRWRERQPKAPQRWQMR